MSRMMGLFLALLWMQQQAPPTFKTGVNLVTIDVSVLDGDGRPVVGLAAEDFEVKLDGRTYPVKLISHVQFSDRSSVSLGGGTVTAPPAVAAATPPAGAPAVPAVSSDEARVYVFLIDDLSFSAMRGKSLFTAADKFVRSLPARDLVGFATSSGVMTVNPSTDRAAVLDAFRRVVGLFSDPRTARPSHMPGGADGGTPDAPVGLMQALNIDRGDLGTLKDVIANECFGGDRQAVDGQNLSALAAENNCVAAVQREAMRTAALIKSNAARQAQAMASIIDVLRPVPGYKQMLILTDGVAVGADIAPLKPIAIAAARAGVRISVLLEDQDLSMADEGRRFDTMKTTPDIGMAARRREDARLVLQGAQAAATMAGGHFFRIVGDPDPAFARAALAGSAVYRLGVEAPAGSAPGRQFALDARVLNRKGLIVAASRVAMAEAPPPPTAPAAPMTVDERLKAALGAGRDVPAIPLTVGTVLRRASNATSNTALELMVWVEAPGTVKGPLVTMFGVVDNKGGMNSGRIELPAPPPGSPFSSSFVVPLSQGNYRLRIAAADPDGALGSVEIPIDAELATMGSFAASELLTAWVDAQGQGHFFVFDKLPSGATSLRTSLELYSSGPNTPADISVEWRVTRVGETDPVEEREASPRVSGALLRAEAEFDRSLFTPGTYTLRATVRLAGEVIGTVVRNLTI